jgi:hypothetical protein
MDNLTVTRIVAGVIIVILLFVLVQRRRNRVREVFRRRDKSRRGRYKCPAQVLVVTCA